VQSEAPLRAAELTIFTHRDPPHDAVSRYPVDVRETWWAAAAAAAAAAAVKAHT
jgi:hypothetical protein